MALTLYYHPLASFCHKVLIALYENETPFKAQLVDLASEASSAEMLAYWPVGKIPVLRDDARKQTVPETSVIIEYLGQHYPGRLALLPSETGLALEARLWDRFFDLYVSTQVTKIVTDNLRPPGQNDAFGVEDARQTLKRAYALAERQLDGRRWAAGDSFTVADCAAAPALFYADIVQPFSASHPHLAEYFERLLQRPSVARTLAEARPYFHMFPLREQIPPRFLDGDR